MSVVYINGYVELQQRYRRLLYSIRAGFICYTCIYECMRNTKLKEIEPSVVMTFVENPTDPEQDLRYNISLLNCVVICEQCNKETQVVESLSFECGMNVCPVCMQKFATQ